MVLKLSFIHNRRKVEKTKESVVELRISAGKERKYISTGVKVLPKEWSNGSVVGRKDWKELNDQIQVIKKKVSEIVTLCTFSMILNQIPESGMWFCPQGQRALAAHSKDFFIVPSSLCPIVPLSIFRNGK